MWQTAYICDLKEYLEDIIKNRYVSTDSRIIFVRKDVNGIPIYEDQIRLDYNEDDQILYIELPD